jgi:hypothetical protein
MRPERASDWSRWCLCWLGGPICVKDKTAHCPLKFARVTIARVRWRSSHWTPGAPARLSPWRIASTACTKDTSGTFLPIGARLDISWPWLVRNVTEPASERSKDLPEGRDGTVGQI